MYACICRRITESDVREVGRAGFTSAADLVPVLGLEDRRCCGRCRADMQPLVELAIEGWSQAPATAQLVRAAAVA